METAKSTLVWNTVGGDSSLKCVWFCHLFTSFLQLGHDRLRVSSRSIYLQVLPQILRGIRVGTRQCSGSTTSGLTPLIQTVSTVYFGSVLSVSDLSERQCLSSSLCSKVCSGICLCLASVCVWVMLPPSGVTVESMFDGWRAETCFCQM